MCTTKGEGKKNCLLANEFSCVQGLACNMIRLLALEGREMYTGPDKSLYT